MNVSRFLPYGRQSIDKDDIEAVAAVLASDYLTTGPTVQRFEAALAAAIGASCVVAVSSGTAALHAACAAAGVSEGDQVIVPAVSFPATANCARFLNAEPVFADVDPDTGLLLPEELERLIGPATRAVLPVHLAGTAVDLSAIRASAEQAGIKVIEDASHALGARYEASAIGAGNGGTDMATFSFHPVKAITTGEGGAIAVNDVELWRRLLAFRNHGIVRDSERLEYESPGPWYYEQQELGYNLRMSDIQAALGLSQLRKLEGFVARRRALAARYDALLEELPIRPVTRPEHRSDSAYHLYSVLMDFEEIGVRRADLMDRLRERGVGTQVHYIPLPMHPYYRARGWSVEKFPGAQRYYRRTLSLPLFPGMNDSDVDVVVENLQQVLVELGAG